MKIVKRTGMPRATEFSITDRQALLEDLRTTRERGYAIDRQEAVLGVCCVGAPVRDFSGRPIASISLSTVREFFEPERIGPWLIEAAIEISSAMGWNGDVTAFYEPVDGSAEALLGQDSRRRSPQRGRNGPSRRVRA
jgi:hypothetical protein